MHYGMGGQSRDDFSNDGPHLRHGTRSTDRYRPDLCEITVYWKILCYHPRSTLLYFLFLRSPSATFLHWLLQSTSGPSVEGSLLVPLPSVYADWLQLYQFAARVSMLEHELQYFRNSLATTEQMNRAIQRGRTILQRMISFKEQLDGGNDFCQSYCTTSVPTIFVNLTADLLNLRYKSVFVILSSFTLAELSTVDPKVVTAPKS
ncbi:hypothetical protein BT69DRAFT_201427 [Atractiella rhizophila]|nr:hypothetical protein BT69DRAFT_201427 [Atractiella rhizophila]